MKAHFQVALVRFPKVFWKLEYFQSEEGVACIIIFVCIFIFHQSQLLPKPQTIIQVIPTGDICDQRILQSNCLKAFPAITQEQEFPQKNR